MASIYREMLVNVEPERAWAALRDTGAAARLFAGVLRACVLDGDVRTVTFESGLTLREQIVALDEDRRRIAYTVLDGRFVHHNASMQVVAQPPGMSRFVWITDLLPGSAAAAVEPLVEAGCAAFKRNLEAAGG
jgi:hypothetical protein